MEKNLKKFLIVRTSAIGDIVFASPFAKAIKETYTNAHVSWLVDKGNEGLLADSPYIDEIITIPASEWKTKWQQGNKWEVIKQIRSFGKKLKDLHFDTTIDLQGLLKSGIFAWMTKAPQRIGLGSREGSQWLMNQVISRKGDPERISSEYLYLAEQLGLKHESFTPSLTVNPIAEQNALDILNSHGLTSKNYIVFAAFTTRPQKHWFNDAWQTLSKIVKEKTGLTPVLLGGSTDKTHAEIIQSDSPDLINLVGKTRLNEAVAIVSHASALIGVDTGLTHMGIAFNVPTICIFGSTCPYTNTTRQNAKVIWLGLPCSPCRRKPTCQGKFTCLRDITPENVLTELLSVLNK